MKSLIQFFEESVEKFESNVYLWEKTQEKYEGTTYGETQKQVYEFAAGLIRLGIKKGDRLSLISEGRNNWVIGELGILYAGAINVPLSVKLTPEEIKFRINHSESRMVLVSSIQANKIIPVIGDCKTIEKIIHFDTQEEYEDNEIHFNEVRKMGREWLETPENKVKFEARFIHRSNLLILQISVIHPEPLPILKGSFLLMEIMSLMSTSLTA